MVSFLPLTNINLGTPASALVKPVNKPQNQPKKPDFVFFDQENKNKIIKVKLDLGLNPNHGSNTNSEMVQNLIYAQAMS